MSIGSAERKSVGRISYCNELYDVSMYNAKAAAAARFNTERRFPSESKDENPGPGDYPKADEAYMKFSKIPTPEGRPFRSPGYIFRETLTLTLILTLTLTLTLIGGPSLVSITRSSKPSIWQTGESQTLES